MATNKTESGRGFDAVAESRRWKEAVAIQTAGLSTRERMAWFRAQSSVASIRDRAQATEQEPLLREELPKYRNKN